MSCDEILEASLTGNIAKAFAGFPDAAFEAVVKTWRNEALVAVRADCKKWLRSCELLTGYEKAQPGTPPFDALLNILHDADVRFRRLAVTPEDRIELVAERLKELLTASQDAKGVVEREGIA